MEFIVEIPSDCPKLLWKVMTVLLNQILKGLLSNEIICIISVCQLCGRMTGMHLPIYEKIF